MMGATTHENKKIKNSIVQLSLKTALPARDLPTGDCTNRVPYFPISQHVGTYRVSSLARTNYWGPNDRSGNSRPG